jgi:hypothetical protein
VIPTLRRSRDDIFLIGEEQILADQEVARDPDPTVAIEGLDGRSSRRLPRPAHLPGSLQGARGFALAGLGAGAVALLAVLSPGGGEGPAHPTTPSPRSPLISRSPAGVPADRTARVHAPAAAPAEVHRPTVHHHRPRRPEAPAPIRPTLTTSEPEREPTSRVAPVSPPVVTPTEPAPGAERAPAATAPSAPPGPPPTSSGGGPAGVESFGFER